MIPNLLSFARIPLGIAFLYVSAPARLALTLAAAVSDGLDGYLARRWNSLSKLGTWLDPLGDKVFAVLSFGSLYIEGSLSLLLLLSLFSREAALALFSLVLIIRGEWKDYAIKAFLFGKIMTTCQFLLLIALLLGYAPSYLLPFGFAGIGLACLLNLFYTREV